MLCCVGGVFRCRRTSAWTPSIRLCREWLSLSTRTPSPHLSASETRKWTTYSWWVPTAGQVKVTSDLSGVRTSQSAPCSLLSCLVGWCVFFFSSVRSCLQGRHNGLLFFLPKKPLCRFFSLKFKGFMSQDVISSKYKGIIVLLLRPHLCSHLFVGPKSFSRKQNALLNRPSEALLLSKCFTHTHLGCEGSGLLFTVHTHISLIALEFKAEPFVIAGAQQQPRDKLSFVSPPTASRLSAGADPVVQHRADGAERPAAENP